MKLKILPWEFDMVEDDKWTFDIENSSVINTRSDVVVSSDCFHVGFCLKLSNGHPLIIQVKRSIAIELQINK